MVLWPDLNRKFSALTNDEGNLFPEELRIHAWNWSQDVFCTHTPMRRKITAAIDKGHREIVLPDDYYTVEGLYDSKNERWWWPMRRHPGDIRELSDDVLEYWVWGNTLTLESSIPYDTDQITILYWAYWPNVEFKDEASNLIQDKVFTPQWAELALMHLTIATCLVPEEIFSSDINQYKTKIESGDPLDNPRMQSADWHLNMYNRLIGKHPPTRTTEALQ